MCVYIYSITCHIDRLVDNVTSYDIYIYIYIYIYLISFSKTGLFYLQVARRQKAEGSYLKYLFKDSRLTFHKTVVP